MKRWIACAVLVACGQPAPVASQVPLPPASSTATSAPPVACSVSAPTYVPVAAWSGARPDLPVPPALPTTPMRVGDAYTVYGAIHTLNSRFGAAELQKNVTIVGYIVDTNLPRAPKCVLHKTGIADPKGCTSEIPTFTIADEKGDRSNVKIRVMGWASNFPNVFEAYSKYKLLTAAPAPSALYVDELWAVPVPYPLPAVGAKVRLTGRYGFTFGKSSAGLEVDPERGILTLDACVTMEPAPRPASFPQLGP